MRSLVRALAPHIQNITIRRWTVCLLYVRATNAQSRQNGVFIDCAKRALEQSK